MRLQLALIAGLVWPGIAAAQDGGAPVIPFSENDSVMNAAIADARASLPLFLANTLAEDGSGPDGGYLKVDFPVDADDLTAEVIWVGPFLALDAENYVGLLANAPVHMEGLALYDRVSFTHDMIVDWSLQSDTGQRYGDYTTRVIMRQLPTDESAPYVGMFMEPAYPVDWATPTQ